MNEPVSKADLRQTYRSARRRVQGQQRDNETMATVAACLRLIARLSPLSIASYTACASELDLAFLHVALWKAGREVLLPRISAPGALAWHAMGPRDELVVGHHGIREPDRTRPELPLMPGCLLFVPGVAFSPSGARLGQGGGYYDRLLPKPGVISVGIGFACQHCEELPLGEHDRMVDGVILAGVCKREPPQSFKS